MRARRLKFKVGDRVVLAGFRDSISLARLEGKKGVVTAHSGDHTYPYRVSGGGENALYKEENLRKDNGSWDREAI